MDSQTEQSQRFLPETLEDHIASWLRRSAGLAVVLFCAATWLALLTWSIHDPSFSHATSEGPRNAIGYPGAYLADALLQTIGIAALFTLMPLTIGGLQVLMSDHIENAQSRMLLTAFSIPSLAAGLAGLPLTSHWQLAYGYGGAFGDIIFDLTSALLANIVPNASGAATGLGYFIFGFWALTHAIGIDRRQIFSLVRSAGNLSGRGVIWCFTSRASLFASLGWFFRLRPGHRTSDTLARANRSESPVPHDPMHESATNRTAGQPAPSYAPDFAISSHLPPSPPDPALDRDEIEASRAIAERFAPAGAHRTCHSAREPIEPTLPGLPPAHREGPPDDSGDRADDATLPRIFRPHSDADDLSPQPSGHNTSMVQPRVHNAGYQRPSVHLLNQARLQPPSPERHQALLAERARQLEGVLADFRIKGVVTDVRPGPVVTLFEFEPGRGIKSSRVIALADDIARNMSAISARISVIPGRTVIGIELPNTKREPVGLRELMEAPTYRQTEAKLPLALGKSISGEPVVVDLARMPHLLMAGTTGSGKSVGINAMILSLLYRLTPDDCRMIMIDPKMLELSVYDNIPHLLTPVVTDPARAVAALNWAVGEMEERYKQMAELGVRNIEFFNNRVRHATKRGELLGQSVQTGFDATTGEAIYEERHFDLEPMPYIVIIVDEFADLMAVAGKEIEASIKRLAQKARAAGIHLVMATQRPSVDVVTGTIKANFPTRISFKVASRIDSRTILNEQGAEQLLGQGDMLFSDGGGSTQRLHGPFVSDEEVQGIAEALRAQAAPNYIAGVADLPEETESPVTNSSGPDDEALYVQGVKLVIAEQRASTSFLQRRLSVGYNRAARLLDRMQEAGIVSAGDGAGRRDVLVDTPAD